VERPGIEFCRYLGLPKGSGGAGGSGLGDGRG